ncbi:hypothetical protein IPJ72_04500 [Candidatus Peregrinibacteria bacterium]|nr:MAG: hypothetical protein IPJ72_04500 [Candidatus Peregrinibacteria bacterium]
MTQVIKTLSDRKNDYLKYESKEKLTWCGGCGNYGIQKALERAMVIENIKPQNAVFFFDIGCSGNGSDKIGDGEVTTFHGLHGRVISAAAAASITNPKMKVIAEAGDGATLSEGVNHLVHGVRSNYPMLFILHNNENYGLTTGQASATTRPGFKMNASPDGVTAQPMNACDFVMSLNPTFVARTFSGDVNHMTEVIQAGLKHNGFAFIEIMQLCPTYNKSTSATWFWDRFRNVRDLKGFNPQNFKMAREVAQDIDKEIAMGILYQDLESKNYLEHLPQRQGKKTTLVDEVSHVDIRPFLKKLA